MLKRGLVVLASVSLLFAGSAFAGKKDDAGNMCKDKDVVGSYTRIIGADFIDGYGNPQSRIYARQLNLNTGGTVHQYESTGFDAMINYGIRSSWLGSWVCRKDGTLLVTVLSSNFAPVAAGVVDPGSVPDVVLVSHVRTTYLFSVEDLDTLQLIQVAAREYDMTENPTDPDAGTLFFQDYASAMYDRLVASDADLLP